MRSAVVDLGSHTFHAVVADADAFGVRRVVYDKKVVTRLGDTLGVIPRAPVIDAIADLVARTRPRAPEQLRVVATGVFRDATNGPQLLADASARCDVAIDLLDGAEQARLTWLGVSAELAGSHGTLAIVDLGGGSLALASGVDVVERSHSLPLGALRLPRVDVRSAVLAGASQAIDDVRAHRIDTLALASGTARALLALARRLGLVGERQRHVCARMFGELARRIAPLAPDAIEVLGVPRLRADTIASGAVALAAVLDALGKPVVYVARAALREGVLIEAARQARASSPRLRAAG